ncbi:VCBS repeat-containing protein [Xanthocytophaga agilis]|uniref:VCBS repeat-containing protein n=1 Tax=Xanthocytophaga agilis TaxID=3048010 RepID=A0AAE3RDI5_9BACT|nr:VCBS repeat-containing protein [Xanthocytophaga agilis]MDJ1506697.1 VCBS repeat-containing protein [Xanthocytophaga agilis]
MIVSILYKRLHYFFLSCFILFYSCHHSDHSTLFTRLSENQTNINFRNLIQESEDMNIMRYSYFYNGGGVAVGDVNNDGLQDIFFSGNMVKNRLYLNKGNLEFEDITQQSQVAEKQGWCTGATMADINADGWLDIYVCRSADIDPEKRKNLLFINNHDNTFTEKAAEYGLADDSYSTHASFFDYDKDGDLDVFVLNHSTREYAGFGKVLAELKTQKNPAYGNKLYRNDNGHFVDISEQAGIISNVLSFGLGLAVSDINMDGWPDIYISNDFNEQDYLYINNQNGTFSEKLKEQIGHTSLFSMGSDIADYNNDSYPDIMTLDMLPEDNKRQKMTSGAENYDKVQLLTDLGFHYQYMRNMLHLNNGNGTFSEIGQLAGVSNTDWSWAALFGDYDNDGYKDLFVTNGYVRDYTDMDFLKYSTDTQLKGEKLTINQIIEKMPSSEVENYIYHNNGDLTFTKKTDEWGLGGKNVSSGAAYADLDNDGDLDLVVNNINEFASIYENNSTNLQQNTYLSVKLTGTKLNHTGIGAKIKIYTKGKCQYQEQMPVRGYESSVDQNVHFGIGQESTIDSLIIIWPSDHTQKITRLQANQTITLKESDAQAMYHYTTPATKTYFTERKDIITYTHTENNFNDFKSQLLIPQMLSRSGPCIAKADVNRDGLEDVYIAGTKGSSGKLFIQYPAGKFTVKPQRTFLQDSLSEDTDALFFDCDGDKDLDLYVVSGGNEFNKNDPLLQDRLYINDGKGNFQKTLQALPVEYESGSCVKASDYDRDGDIDLFVGSRLIPGKYPMSPQSFLLINDGQGHFSNQIQNISPTLQNAGMITDATWVDLNKDQAPDLIVCGEWMPIKVFIQQQNKLTDQSAQWISEPSSGFWNKIHATDFDKDGDLDFVAGNLGLNSQIKVSVNKPASIYYRDFDDNGTLDPILCYYVGDVSYPMASRDDMLEQIPVLRKKFTNYATYSTAQITNFFTEDLLKTTQVHKAERAESVYIENTGSKLILKPLPIEAQYAPIYAILSEDVNQDSKPDLILAGNLSTTRVKFGKYDASYGLLLLGDGKGYFTSVPPSQVGLYLKGDIRCLQTLSPSTGKKILLAGVNNNAVVSYEFPIR